jgi:hypothetical protein
MSWDTREAIDWDEMGTLLRLFPSVKVVSDIRLFASSNKNPIRGDGVGIEGDDECLHAIGYAWKNQVLGTASSKLQSSTFWILRNVDSATASFSSFLSNSSTSGQWKSGWVILEIHKAGGGNIVGAKKPQPLVKFELSDACCIFQGFVTCSDTGVPMEILGFSFSSVEKSTTGQMGKVRVCRIGNV